MATLDFQELFESQIKHNLNVRRNLYVATGLKTNSIPPSHGDVHFKYSNAFKRVYCKTVDCYTTYGLN